MDPPDRAGLERLLAVRRAALEVVRACRVDEAELYQALLDFLRAYCQEQGKGRRVWLRLSPRQREIARLAAVGANDARIAAQLNLSTTAVRYHLNRMQRLFGVRSREELVGCLHELHVL